MIKKDNNMTIVIILLAIGFCAGMLSGVVGIGGGIIIVPALIFFLGMNQHEAQGTTLALMLPPIGILAVFNYYKQGMVDIRTSMIIAVAFIIGGYFGSKLSLALPADILKKVFGALIMAIAIRMMFWK